ncbi:MAG: hypothetical protein VR72_15680 [Clostridiaceae bacterium BRH_c20a]|nr:MAG: hypothetical protein VR72_15680 [Clostridiaceae bacterium BRH_c20a]
MKHKKLYEVPSIIKTIKIIEFLHKNKEATFTEIFTDLDIPKSTAYQILSTLEFNRYIKQDQSTGKYLLGFKFFELGFSVGETIDIRKEALPVLKELTNKTHLTAQIGILDGLEAVYLEKVESPDGVFIRTRVGKRSFLHCTAIGKAILAWQKEEIKENLLQEIQLIKNTETTITEVNLLRQDLQITRKRGFSFDNEENLPHIRGIGVPIWGVDGEVKVAISISGLTTQISFENAVDYLPFLEEASNILSIR